MITRRLLSLALLAGGMLTFLIGLESEVKAVLCEPRIPISPARCVPTHIVPPPYPVNMFCQSYLFYWCVPASDSSCGMVQGYATGVQGQCHFKQEEQQQQCTENTKTVIIVLRHHHTYCDWMNNQCRCLFGYDTLPPVAHETCDCEDGPYVPR